MDLSLIIPIAISSSGVLITLIMGIYAISRNAKKDKEKYATKTDLVNIKTEFDLKIEMTNDKFEETRSLIEAMAQQVNYIYKKHYKP